MSAIALRDIEKSFGETRALAGASLACDLGEIHAIVGENGSGKSTLAKVIAGVLRPDAGDVDILGCAPQTPGEAIAAGIATIFQEILVAETLTVWENLFAGSDGFWQRRTPTTDKRRTARETMERLAGVAVDPDAIVAALPLNIRQWIVIARAILRRPRVLVFDESSAALDLDAANRLHREMLALKAAGSCVILVTHRIAELVRIADSATVLRDGRTVGRLGKAEITEANILRLMQAEAREAGVAKRDKRVVSTAQKPALEAAQVRLRPGAAPVDFRVYPGEIVGIAGLDGAGQADFVAMLAGILPTPSGRVQVWEGSTEARTIVALDQAEWAGITYVSGDRKREGIFPNLSILENFGLALRDRRTRPGGLIDRAGVRRTFADEERRLKIKYGHSSDRIVTLSGGNQQKVLIARAFARAPKVIVLNDPARGVDIGTKQDLYAHLRQFASNGGAVVYLSTEIEEFPGFADRVAVFFEGTIYASFGAGEITEAHLLSAMFGQARPVAFDEDVQEGVA